MKSDHTRFRKTFVAVVCCLAGSHFGASLLAETLRTWSDVSGNYRVEASFIDHESGNVQLRKADGTELSVPVDVLSPSDRNYVIAQLRRRQIATRRGEDKAQPERAIAEAKPRVSLETVNADTLFGVNWCKPEEAGIAAGAGQKEQKPVMWFRVLGDLSGFM